jgi:hypothetical protein|tara:strand:- start:1497 stop:1721 length:225 start_codon:yes stop_codon:yes gene_type:complete
MAFRVVKQLFQAPSSSVSANVTFNDPNWATRNVYIASSSDMQLWEFSTEAEAIAKMNELTGSDSTDRKYRVDEI